MTAALVSLLTLFLVLFPKGGVKVSSIPLTWGYMLLSFSFPPLLIIRVWGAPLSMSRRGIFVLASLLPFLLLFVYSWKQNGVGDTGSLFSALVSFVVLPIAFLFIYPAFYKRVDGRSLARLLRFCVLAAALFGLYLFVTYPLTGHLLEIPYLTVNADDYGLLESTKHIVRGPFLKLISTYNNGNLYGVATLILLPLYNRLERSLWKRTAIKLALVLTLSRTIWAGLIVDQVLSLGRLIYFNLNTFPRVLLGPAARRSVLLLITLVAIFGGFLLVTSDYSFLFDSSLGGRSGLVTASVQNFAWLPSTPILPFFEVIYAAALYEYGLLGLFAVVLILTSPVLVFLSDRKVLLSPIRSAALKGLILYIFLAGVDGALNLIPVMAFYWFTYMIFLYGWPGGFDLPVQAVQPDSSLSAVPSRPLEECSP